MAIVVPLEQCSSYSMIDCHDAVPLETFRPSSHLANITNATYEIYHADKNRRCKKTMLVAY